MDSRDTSVVTTVSGYDIGEDYRDGTLRLCHVFDGDKHLRSFHGESARDEALRLACTAFDRKCSRCRKAEDDGETCFKVLTCPTGIAHRAVYAALSLTPAGKGERGKGERKS